MIFYAALFLVQAIKEDGGLDKDFMFQGLQILKSVYPVEELAFDLDGYDKLRKLFADAWRLYYFQKLV